MSQFRELLRQGVVFFDGAMGTRLDEAGLAAENKVAANVSHPEAVAAIHRSYVEVGSQVILTNTFTGNGIQLAKAGFGDRVAEFCTAAVRIARDAADGRALVAASVGPTGDVLEPYGDLKPAQAVEAFAAQIGPQAEAGLDLIVVETFGSLEEIEAAIEAAGREAAGLPVVATMSFDTGERTMFGVGGEAAGKRLAELGCDVVGANCAYGEGMVAAVQQMAQAVEVPVLVQPNAGRPQLVEGRTVFPASPDDLASEAEKFHTAGARLFGACCGSGAEHVRAVIERVRALADG